VSIVPRLLKLTSGFGWYSAVNNNNNSSAIKSCKILLQYLTFSLSTSYCVLVLNRSKKVVVVSHMSIKQTRMGDSNLFCRRQGGLGPNTSKAGPLFGKTRQKLL